MSSEAEGTDTELCLMDCGLQNIQEAQLSPQLHSIFLHSNRIQHISGLEGAYALRHLDLSANQISRISGLDTLTSLKTLNLSCNLITHVNGICCLRYLMRLNLSYNHIVDLSGLKLLGTSGCRLSHLNLHGNKLSSLQHLHCCLTPLSILSDLTVNQDGSSNPFCVVEGYEKAIFANLPHLRNLNGMDYQGQISMVTDDAFNLLELDGYLDFFHSIDGVKRTDTSLSTDVPPRSMTTVKIDEVLEKFRTGTFSKESVHKHSVKCVEGTVTTGPATTVENQQSDCELASLKMTEDGGHENERLNQLEDEIAKLRLVQNQITSNIGSSLHAGKSTLSQCAGFREVMDEESDDNVEPVRDGFCELVRSRPKSSSDLGGKRASKSVVGRGNKDDSDVVKVSAGQKTRTRSMKRSGSRHRSSGNQPTTNTANDGGSVGHCGMGGGESRDDCEHERRDAVRSTYLQLLRELEAERERRWKSEQAARKLADLVMVLRTKGDEDSKLQATVSEANDKLTEAVKMEKELNIRLPNEISSLKTELDEVHGELSKTRNVEHNLRVAARRLDDSLASSERNHLSQRAYETKRLQDSELKSAAMAKEVELLRWALQSQKVQVQQLHELLASREQQHVQEMSGRYQLGSKELKEVLRLEVQSVEERHKMQVSSYQEKVGLLNQQYNQLEDEFRLALRMEADRYQEIQREYEQERKESNVNKQLLSAARKKDEQSSTLLTELTALVKEQKGRLSELSRAKQEVVSQYRERVECLETKMEEARKQSQHFELLKQENIRMQSTIHAQESLIGGLKAERRLWGQELAQQGASLSQDRGRLEIKIEALNQEVLNLKKELERETDLVRIKTKMIDDQTETVRNLKEGLVERDNEVKRTRSEALELRKALEESLAEERVGGLECQELLDRANNRKAEMKSQLSAMALELESCRQQHREFSGHWREKVKAIGHLEEQVKILRQTWNEKEERIVSERDKAIEAGMMAVSKVKKVEHSFREQLEAREKAHREDLSRVTKEKQLEINAATRKVDGVEREMRDLLKEAESSKRGLEEKVKKLTYVLGDLQSDLM